MEYLFFDLIYHGLSTDFLCNSSAQKLICSLGAERFAMVLHCVILCPITEIPGVRIRTL